MLTPLIGKIKKDFFLSFLYLYVFLMPWNFSNGQMGLLSVILLLWWLIIGKSRGYFKKLKNIFHSKPLIIFMLFLAWSYLSLLWTDNFEWAEISLKYYKYYWIMIPVFFTSLSKEEALRLFYTLMLSMGVYALFSLSIASGMVEIHDHTTSPNSPSNPRGILAYAVVTPYMAIATLSLATMSLFSQKKSIKYLFALLSFASLIALCLNNGRAGQLAFLVTLLLLMVIYREYFFTLKRFIVTISIITISLFTMHSLGKTDRINYGIKELLNIEKNGYSGSFGQRAYMWVAAAELIPKHPIIGAGAGDNIDEFIEFTKTHPSKAVWLRSYHNQHFDTLTKYGIIGYLLLWGAIAWLLYLLRKNQYYFTLAFIFFCVTFIDGIGDIILLMKPYNNTFMLIFLLFCILANSGYKQTAYRN